MDEDLRIELFTAADIRAWLKYGKGDRGLSEKIISRQRALSFVRNPYVNDEDPLLAVIFVNDEVAAYNGLFVERMARPGKKICWNSMLYVAPKYEGRGYGAIVIDSLLEHYEGNLYDHAAAPASIENFKFLGQHVSYVPQYIFDNKHIRVRDIKGVLAKLKSEWDLHIIRSHRAKEQKRLAAQNYEISYVAQVDDVLYAFIESNSQSDCWLRTQESFNWMLSNPFSTDAPLYHRIAKENVFVSEEQKYRTWAVTVRQDHQTGGFYILRMHGGELYIKYLYHTEKDAEMVYDSILEHILQLNPDRVITYKKSLANYLNRKKIYQRETNYPTSFIYPPEYEYNDEKEMQAGDGDMFS